MGRSFFSQQATLDKDVYKRQTQMSKFWFDYTRDLLPNHMLSVDVKDMPEFFQHPQFDGNSMMCRCLLYTSRCV